MVGRRNNALLAPDKPHWQEFKAGPRENDYFTDLAVRVGDAATAAEMRIMASLQRSAAEPVNIKGSVLVPGVCGTQCLSCYRDISHGHWLTMEEFLQVEANHASSVQQLLASQCWGTQFGCLIEET